MFDLTETPEGSLSVPSDPFYTHDDGTHWVHSSLYIDNPRVDCWFTPDALVMWHPEVFTFDFKTPVSPLLRFQTFAPEHHEAKLKDCVGGEWVVCERTSFLEADTYGYIFVNSWGKPSDCIEHFKSVLSARLYRLGVLANS